MAAPASEGVRQSGRAPVPLRISYEHMNSFFADYTKTLSKGSIFIKTRRPKAVGSPCHFAILVPALAEPLFIAGEVSLSRSPSDAAARNEEPGMEVKLIFADAAARKKLDALVQRLMEEALGADLARGLLRR